MSVFRMFSSHVLRKGAFCLFAASVALPSLAYAQSATDFRSLASRINQVEAQLQTLSRQIYRGEPQGQTNMQIPETPQDRAFKAGLELRLNQLEQQLRNLNGRLEEVQFQTSQIGQNLTRVQTDLEMRMNDAEQKLAAMNAPQPTQATALTPTVNGQTRPVAPVVSAKTPTTAPAGNGAPQALSQDDPTALYNAAFGLIRQRDYVGAADKFQNFMNQYPQHELAGNAQYWLAETYYVRDDFDTAARMFAKGYQTYPEGNKAPDNLLKLSLSLAELNRPEDACLSLRQLDIKYPNAPAAISQRATREKQRLNCQ